MRNYNHTHRKSHISGYMNYVANYIRLSINSCIIIAVIIYYVYLSYEKGTNDVSVPLHKQRDDKPNNPN